MLNKETNKHVIGYSKMNNLSLSFILLCFLLDYFLKLKLWILYLISSYSQNHPL